MAKATRTSDRVPVTTFKDVPKIILELNEDEAELIFAFVGCTVSRGLWANTISNIYAELTKALRVGRNGSMTSKAHELFKVPTIEMMG